VAEDTPRLVPYDPEPEFTPHTNGHRRRARARVFPGVTFGVLLGALLATSLVPRLQWLNLATIGWWGRPVAAAAGAGAMVGAFRRDDLRPVLAGGAIAGLLSLWGVYGLVRLSVHVLFVDRSIVRVVTADLLRLLAFGAPGGAAGAAAGWGARVVVERSGNERPGR
jgi:hypothetical protein